MVIIIKKNKKEMGQEKVTGEVGILLKGIMAI